MLLLLVLLLRLLQVLQLVLLLLLLLGADESELLAPEAAAWYRTGVGKIGYLLQSKPELCLAFSELSRT
jgi:hypothetical protein